MAPSRPDMDSTVERDLEAAGNYQSRGGGGGHHEIYDRIVDDDWTYLIKLITTSPVIFLKLILKDSSLRKQPVLQMFLEYDEHDLLVNEVIPELEPEDLETTNSNGDTALHIAASKGYVDVATALIDKNVKLLEMRNSDGEIPLHRAALKGHRRMFWELYIHGGAHQYKIRRFNGTTAFHCAVLAYNFELANEMFKRHRTHFLLVRDQLGLTVLHHLVSMPNAFRSGCQLNLLDSLLYSCIPRTNQESALSSNAEGDEGDEEDVNNFMHHDDYYHTELNNMESVRGHKNGKLATYLNLPAKWIRQQVYNFVILKYRNDLITQKKMHEDAMNLLSSIVRNAEYWQFLHSGNIPDQSRFLSDHRYKKDKVMEKWMETPLTLAARYGLEELVLKILEIRPIAAIYRGKEGKNLLHVAVENRQELIVDRLNRIEEVDRRISHQLKTSRDDNDNTILHLAAIPNCQSPSSPMQMLEEFKWFEKVKKILPIDLRNHRNKDGKTAQELFTECHEKMVEDSKKQLTDTALACSSALVSAVTFAAGFSIINGNNKENKKDEDHQTKVALNIFSHTYMFGLSCTAMALLQFMSLIMASYKEEDFRTSVPTQFMLAFASLFSAMLAMVVAFGCNTYIGIHNNLNSDHWKNYLWVTIEVFIFPLICLLVMCFQGVRFPFFSVIQRYLR